MLLSGIHRNPQNKLSLFCHVSEITNTIIHKQFKQFQFIMSYTENSNYDVTLAMSLDKENTYN